MNNNMAIIFETLGRLGLYMVVFMTCGYVMYYEYGLEESSGTAILGVLGILWVIAPLFNLLNGKEKQGG